MRLFFAILLTFSSSLSYGQSTSTGGSTTTGGTTTTGTSQIQSLSGFSQVTGLYAGNINTSSTVVYGGVAGGLTGGCASPSQSSTCNNCEGSDGLTSCNTTRIHDDLLLTIQWRPDSSGATAGTIGGLPFVVPSYTSGSTPTGLTIVNQSPAGKINPLNVTSVSVSVSWKEICTKVLGSPTSSCENNDFTKTGNQILRLGIDVNNDGVYTDATVQELQVAVLDLSSSSVSVCKEGDTPSGACNFIAYPGDKKVYIDNIRTDCSFPTIGSSQATSIRAFAEEFDPASGSNPVPTALSKKTKDFLISNTSSSSCSSTKEVTLAENEFDGLVNGQSYSFGIAVLDAANNLGSIVNLGSVGAETDNSTCYTPSDSYPLNCHVATPDEVLGLIEKEWDCFITTAAYGSVMEPKVKDFRRFRNQFLHPTWLGRKVIQFYYRNSPPLAQWIHNHPSAKPVARLLLWPLWAFAKLCIGFPVSVSLALVSLLLLVLFRKKFSKGLLS